METPRKLDLYHELANFRTDKNPQQVKALGLLRSGKIKYLLYGGALGGGKSYFLRWYLVCRLIELARKTGIRNLPAMLACEDYPSLKDRQLTRIISEFPPWLGKYCEDHKAYGRCFMLAEDYGAGVICFRNLDDPSKYQSSEWALIGVDELTKNDYDTFTQLRMRLRFTGLDDPECQFVGCSNPGGVGHGWVKQLWMDRNFSDEWISPIDYRPSFAYVPAVAKDNPYLSKGYWAVLHTLPKNLQKPFILGDWNIFVGQAFPELSKVTHGYKIGSRKQPFPPGSPIYMTFDWGFGKPFSIAWWHTDGDGRVYRAASWYGWNGTPDTGLRLEDSKIAQGIVDRETKMGIWKKVLARYAGPDCFSKKPDYKGGGQGPSTAEVFSQYGINLSRGDPSRELKIRQFRERLKVVVDEKGVQVAPPMMLISEADDNFWRTVPNLVMDTTNPEDIDTSGEDHIFDELCHICMARPMAVQPKPTMQTIARVRIDSLEKVARNTVEDFITQEVAESQRFWDQMGVAEDVDRPASEWHYGDVG